jgi:hypothetical protein
LSADDADRALSAFAQVRRELPPDARGASAG